MSELPTLQQQFVGMCLSSSAPDVSELASEDERARLLLYRNMVRWRFHTIASDVFLRTKASLGEAPFNGAVDRWMAEVGPRSRFFRDLPVEIGEFMLAGELPALARDLLMLEKARWIAGIALDGEAPQAFALESVCVPSPSLVLFEAGHAVHVGGEDRPQAMHYAVYRKPNLEITTRWFGKTMASLLFGWTRQDSAAIEVVRAVLVEEKREPTPAFVEEMTSFLATLIEEGAILGSRPVEHRK